MRGADEQRVVTSGADVCPPSSPSARGDRLARGFVVPLPPHGKGRPRFVGGRAVTPQATRDYEAAVALAARAAGLPRFDGPVEVHVRAFYARPKRPVHRDYPLGRPDADNVAKCVLDGLRDHFADEHVVELHVQKRYAAHGLAPCVDVFVRSLA